MSGKGQRGHTCPSQVCSTGGCFGGLQNPCQFAPSSLSCLTLPGEERGEGTGQVPPTMLGAGEELSNITRISQMIKTSWGKGSDVTQAAKADECQGMNPGLITKPGCLDQTKEPLLFPHPRPK